MKKEKKKEMNQVRTKTEIQTSNRSSWRTLSTSSAITLLLPDPEGKHRNYKFDISLLLDTIYSEAFIGNPFDFYPVELDLLRFKRLCECGNVDGYHDIDSAVDKLLQSLIPHTMVALQFSHGVKYVPMFDAVRVEDKVSISIHEEIAHLLDAWFMYAISDNLAIRSVYAKKLHALITANMDAILEDGLFISMEGIAEVMDKEFESQSNAYDKQLGIHTPSSLMSYVNRAVASINSNTSIPSRLGKLVFTPVKFKGEGKGKLEGYEITIRGEGNGTGA